VNARGVTLTEVLVVAAIIAVLAGIASLSYRSYTAARAPAAAAATLAADVSLLQRLAENGKRDEGASLIVLSSDPLAYRGYRGRPTSVDPNSALGAVVMERRFPDVRLASGPIGVATPLLLATDGSAQYVASGVLSEPHATIELTLAQRPSGTTARVTLDLLTGAVSHL
jgi:prepilin-type N-terminal cleavage/methylation domain-containing protein